MNIHRTNDCGNSPKQKFVEDLTIAILSRDLEFIEDHITDKLTWTNCGKEINDTKCILSNIVHGLFPVLDTIHIHHTISHGKNGAANGIAVTDKSKRISFAFFFVFGSAKGNSVSEVETYLIENSDISTTSR